MIIIYTRAYNAEATLKVTIESILAQSYTNFNYVLFDNGSLDSTLDIMRKYAHKDNRIIILSRELNMKSFTSNMEILKYIINNYSEEDYFCNIDADDTYHPDFMKNMIAFAEDNQLDTAFSGYNVCERNTKKILSCKKVEKNMIMKHSDLANYFMEYRRFTTDMWAKLFKISLLKYYFSSARFESLGQMNHTQQNFIYDALSNSAKVGILSEALMNYYESNISQKNMRMAGEISLIQYRDIFRIMERFLNRFHASEEKRKKNESYIYAIYFGYIKDAVAVIEHTNAMSFLSKLTYYFDIFSHYITKDMLTYDAADEFYSLSKESKEDLCKKVISFLKSSNEYETHKAKIESILQVIEECGVQV